MRIEELTRRWAAGWAHVRGAGVGELAGWPLVYVGSASRTTEIVCADPGVDTWTALVERVVGDPTAMLTLVADELSRYLRDLPAGVRLDRDDETLMRLDPLSPTGPRELEPPGFEVDRDDVGDRIVLRLSRDGRVASEGTVGRSGRDAVFDRIETTPRFRRRGLARWVVRDLTATVAARGARTGLLVATEEGAALYRTLGWAEVAHVVSIRGDRVAPTTVAM